MCVFKQGENWWYEFTVDGKRLRKSSRTTDRGLAELIEAEHRERVEKGLREQPPTLEAMEAEKKAGRLQIPAARSAPPGYIAPTMALKEAGMIWLEIKAWQRLKPKTLECSRDYLQHLLDFFGDKPICEIDATSIRDYQNERIKTVGPAAVNHETISLGGILRQAGLWGKIEARYAPLPTPEWQRPKVFTAEEQEAIFEAAKSDPDLELADIVFTITRNTSASGTELRLARLQNIHFETNPPTFDVTADTTKNTIRPRVIPLNAAAEDAFRRAVNRANKLGAFKPGHFIFPFRVQVNPAMWDPQRPTSKSWLRKQTENLRELTGIEHLRPHAWRHQLCTELLEGGVAPQSVKAIMGWCSERMIEVYSHTRLRAKEDAIRVLSRIGQGRVADQDEDVLANPTVQAEIRRQVELAMQNQKALRPSGTGGGMPSGVILFPRANTERGDNR
jgi:integrase